ncbi:hypothetical protein PoB_004762100 [Plakobranchus ocellatus]|uniref:Uncharacterized protein n=1 Tax=Plakobranchus ocellatus TaxID=259542 RepID=A0AAV4BCN4_9GAST|nr:hypothetical protein PoB_004762100 [Plakobranchus ocellatus]
MSVRCIVDVVRVRGYQHSEFLTLIKLTNVDMSVSLTLYEVNEHRYICIAHTDKVSKYHHVCIAHTDEFNKHRHVCIAQTDEVNKHRHVCIAQTDAQLDNIASHTAIVS